MGSTTWRSTSGRSPGSSAGAVAYGMAGILGRVVATERRPNTPHEFHFWTALDAPVGIGTIVRVEGTDAVAGHVPQVYGVVVEGFSYSDLATPLHDVLGADG